MSTNPHCPTCGPHAVPADPFASPVIAGGMFTFTPVAGYALGDRLRDTDGSVQQVTGSTACERDCDDTPGLCCGPRLGGAEVARGAYRPYDGNASLPPIHFPREGSGSQTAGSGGRTGFGDAYADTLSALGDHIPLRADQRTLDHINPLRDAARTEPTLLDLLEKRLHARVDSAYRRKRNALERDLRNALGNGYMTDEIVAICQLHDARLRADARNEVLASVDAALDHITLTEP